MSKQTMFQSNWLNEPQFSSWLQRVDNDSTLAKCKVCFKNFNLSNMGRRALSSHMNSEKHKKSMSACNKSASLQCFFKTGSQQGAKSTSLSSACVVTGHEDRPEKSTQSQSETQLTQQAQSASCTKPRGLEKFVINDNVTKSEILWSVESVMTHTSMRSAGHNVTLFKRMFPDSDIAARMQLQRDKISYTIVYGIAPFFQSELLRKVNQSDFLVVGFDEALNKVSQKKQMDLNVRFWDPECNEVSTRYLTSVFLGRSTAEDVLKGFKQGTKDIDMNKIVQISMDGPNVNFKFLRDLQEDIKINATDEAGLGLLLDIGSCGLHTLHGAFKSAMIATGWNIECFLRSLYNLFKDTPARRALFTNITGSTVFPKKFCPVRWLQNVDVSERAIEMIPNLKLFVQEIDITKSIETSSFQIVAKSIKDPLLPPKLEFFKSLAGDMETFLKQFQTDCPMAPFLYGDLSTILKEQMDRIIVPKVMEETKSLTAIKLAAPNLLPAKQIKIGIVTDRAISRANGHGKQIKDLDLLLFREDCKKSIIKFIEKMLDRSPLKFKLTKAISSLDPKLIVQNEKSAKVRMESLLKILIDNNWVSSLNVDRAMREYSSLLSQNDMRARMKEYSRKTRLDHFWSSSINMEDSPNILRVMRLVLSLSHGNANVERGFSINAECIVDNMREELLIARRVVYDTVSSMGGIEKLKIEKPLINASRNAYTQYVEASRVKKKLETDIESEKSKKRAAMFKVKELEEKRKKVIGDAQRELDLLNDEIKSLS